ncbi:EthD domain-containing protein [Dendryphion nanum]|uniref:EthD domain-containing protein n=1 Tax=Dendryphion nanum TaxID=256645 RepID=A0A9P9J204_9PLEO|nr:EthD domain-containing protein [Dendryphion nanum]
MIQAMKEYSVILFITRKPTLTTEQFRNHWENVHIPLLQDITGHLFPKLFTRRYLARTERQGFGGPANRDRPLLVLRGNLETEFDFDAIAEMTFESEKAFHEFYKCTYEAEAARKLAADEDSFLDPGKTKTVVVGDTTYNDK